jgi:hypothetical protein
MHQARYSSDMLHPSDATYAGLWQALVDSRVEFLLSGHSHDYERWVPQDANGNAVANGVVQFVVGTGGGSSRWLSATQPANSVVRDVGTYGVLELTLRANAYDWEFLPVAGSTFTDKGTASCQ